LRGSIQSKKKARVTYRNRGVIGVCSEEQQKENNLPLRIAHIGAGEWSRYAHGPTLQRLAQQSVVSLELICDLQIERARAFRDLFHYRLASNNIREALSEARPDAIVCTVQPAATAELVKNLLPLRIPLFIEKPPGVSLVEATSLASAAAKAEAFTFVAFNRRAIPSMVRLKQWAAYHPIRFARAEMLRTKRLEPRFAIETGIHTLDAIRFLMGDPQSIEVIPRRHDDSAACDYLVRLNFPDSAVAEISMMLNTGLRRESYFLSSEGASAEAVLGSAYSSSLSYQGERQWSDERIASENTLANDPLIDGGFLGEYEQFFRALREGAPSPCSLSDAAKSMQLAEAVQNHYSGRLPPLSLA
jgi:myo-inositol 2-dehydrogenase/D-chiro-inositol 1-dehydrogenase